MAIKWTYYGNYQHGCEIELARFALHKCVTCRSWMIECPQLGIVRSLVSINEEDAKQEALGIWRAEAGRMQAYLRSALDVHDSETDDEDT